MAQTVKQALHELADQLPDSATWNDVLHEAYLRQEIASGLSEADNGELASDDEVVQSFSKWGVSIATQVD